MPLIRRRRIPLPLEHMPQMPSALTAHNLRARHAERTIGVPGHGAGDVVKVGGPAAAGLELVVGFVEGGAAAGAAVDARRGHVFVVGSGEGGFGAFFAEDAELVCPRWMLAKEVTWLGVERERKGWR